MISACGNATALGMIKRSVINMSIGGSNYQPLDDMVQRAYAQGMTVVVAASNFGADACGFSPARGPNATAVAAIDKSDTRPSWSNYGACVDMFAPGVDITSAWPSADGRAYATLSGTSMGESPRASLHIPWSSFRLPYPPPISFWLCRTTWGGNADMGLLGVASFSTCSRPGDIPDVAREPAWL